MKWFQQKRKKIPFKIYLEIAKRDDLICKICGLRGKFKIFTLEGNKIRMGVFFKNKRFEIDHIIPVSRGGKDELENLRLSCIRCNRSKGSKL